VPFPNQEKKEQLIAEVHFLRAYFYYVLMAQYGGVILLDKPVEWEITIIYPVLPLKKQLISSLMTWMPQ
jgi:hypothetical protein